MCEFISAIKKNGGYLYLTGRDLKTSRGRKMRERIGEDVCGHGAIREYWGLKPNDGKEFECSDFSTPDNFPACIVESIKNGEFRGIGIAPDLLTPEARDAHDAQVKTLRDAYDAQVKPLQAAYYAQVKPLRDAHDAQVKPLLDAYYAQVKTLRDAYDAQVKTLWDACDAQVNSLLDAYYAQVKPLRDAYDKKGQRIFWDLFADPSNRPEAWR